MGYNRVPEPPASIMPFTGVKIGRRKEKGSRRQELEVSR
jgi:hypothetical protein